MIHNFSPETEDNLKFYVYCLVDPRDQKVFYIGKGKGQRVFQHAKAAITTTDASDKLDLIRDIIRSGNEVKHYIIRHGIEDEGRAYLLESTLIDFLTYHSFNLKNVLTNIQAGHHRWEEGIKTADELELLYNCEPIKPEPNGVLLLVSLNKSYDQTNANGIYQRPDIYECTRKYWKLDKSRLSSIDYVLGVYKGVVRSVYQPKKWLEFDKADDGTEFKSTRYGFEGDEIKDSPYLNKSVKDYPFGNGGCIKYLAKSKLDE